MNSRAHEELTAEELELESASELPNREAMSLIDTGGGLLTVYPGPTDTPETFGPAADTTGATDTANDVAGTAADASGSQPDTANVISDDRSEQITQSDSAFSST